MLLLRLKSRLKVVKVVIKFDINYLSSKSFACCILLVNIVSCFSVPNNIFLFGTTWESPFSSVVFSARSFLSGFDLVILVRVIRHELFKFLVFPFVSGKAVRGSTLNVFGWTILLVAEYSRGFLVLSCNLVGGVLLGVGSCKEILALNSEFKFNFISIWNRSFFLSSHKHMRVQLKTYKVRWDLRDGFTIILLVTFPFRRLNFPYWA